MDKDVRLIINDIIEKFIKPIFGDEPIPDNCKEMMDAFVKKGGNRDEIDDYLWDVPDEYDYPTYAKCVLELGLCDKNELFANIVERAVEDYEFMVSDISDVVECLFQLDQEKCARFLEEHYLDIILSQDLDFDQVEDFFDYYISIKGEDALIAYLDNHFANNYVLNSQRDWHHGGDSVLEILLALLTVTDIPLVVNYVLERYLLISHTTCPIDTIYPYIKKDGVSLDILIEGAISRYTRGEKLIDVMPLLEAAINKNSDKAKSVLGDLCRKEIQSKGPCRSSAKKVLNLLSGKEVKSNKSGFATGITTTQQKKSRRENLGCLLMVIIPLAVFVAIWMLFGLLYAIIALVLVPILLSSLK